MKPTIDLLLDCSLYLEQNNSIKSNADCKINTTEESEQKNANKIAVAIRLFILDLLICVYLNMKHVPPIFVTCSTAIEQQHKKIC